MSVCCECCVLSGRGLSVWSLVWRSPTDCAVSECDLEASWKERPWQKYGPKRNRKKMNIYNWRSEWKIISQLHNSCYQLILMNQNKPLCCWCITCNTSYVPFCFMCQCACASAYKCWVFFMGGVIICGIVKNILWGWGEWVLCSLWPRLSCILRLALMCNLIRFTDICLQLSLLIFLAKHETTLDHAMTLPLIWRAFPAVALLVCTNWVPADTPDRATVFHLFVSSALLSAKFGSREYTWFFFLPSYLLSAIGGLRGSVLAFSTQVRGFKPGRSRRILRTKKSSARFPSEGK